MPGPKTIAEALLDLPSSSSTVGPSSAPLQTSASGRRLLVSKKRFVDSAEAESHKPAILQWTRQQTHIRIRGNKRGTGDGDREVKEAILIAGRDSGVKQLLRFNCALPLPFLEQNGPHDDDAEMDVDGDMAEDFEGQEGGLTLSDLEMDMGDKGGAGGRSMGNNEGGGLTLDFFEEVAADQAAKSAGSRTKASSHDSKRRRIDIESKEKTNDETLPRDFLALLKSEISGGKSTVSPGDFARIWKMSGRKIGNDMVVAQNEYFSTASKGEEKTARRRTKSKGR